MQPQEFEVYDNLFHLLPDRVKQRLHKRKARHKLDLSAVHLSGGIETWLIPLLEDLPGEIEELDLSHNNFDRSKRIAVLQALAATNLKVLNLTDYNLGPEGACILAKSNFIELILETTHIGDEGAKALALNTNLRKLNLLGCGIGPIGAQALASSHLIVLNLGYNHIGNEGAEALASSNNLTELTLFSNHIGPIGTQALALSNNLIVLNLDHNPIGDNGAKALSSSNSLIFLSLSGCEIGPEGARALALSTSLRKLYLYENKIGPEGAKALALNTSLRTLEFWGYEVGGKIGEKALAYNSTLLELGMSSTGNKYDCSNSKILSETNPVIRANYGKEAGIKWEVPSLLRLCLFKVKNSDLDQSQLPIDLLEMLAKPRV